MAFLKLRFAALRPFLLSVAAAAMLWTPIAYARPLPKTPTASVDAPTPWLYRGSDIPVDTAWTFGELPNGLRYAVRKNGVPPGQVSIRVAIDAGSLVEGETERGYAHFLEHLSFRGSRYAADGEAKRVWQRLGATFGSDSNAETSQTQTIYRLDLPQANEASLDESLKILSGMMAAPTMTAAEVDAERRTVMAEARERNGAQVRVQEAMLGLFFAGQPLANRAPIGAVETLAAATPASLRAFHDRWYRPDMTVIAISGDVAPDLLAKLIEKHFSGWKAEEAAPPKVDFGKPQADAQATAFLAEPGMPINISLAWLKPWLPKADTIALNQGRLVEIIASRIINRRLEQMARAGSSFLEAGVQQDAVARSAEVTQVGITPLDGNWEKALTEVRSVIADAIARPPSQSEIDRESAEFQAALDVQVETARAEASAKQADDIIEAVNIRETVASPEVARDVFAGMMGRLRPADVQMATARLFSGIGPRVLVTSQTIEAEGAMRLAKALATPVPTRAKVSQQAQVRLDQLPAIGQPGQVVRTREIVSLGVDLLTLSNGVKVLLGPSTSEAGRIYVSARFGRGLMSLPRDRLTPVWAVPALADMGVATLNQDHIDQMTSGRQISLSFSVGEDAFTLRATTRPADLADQLRLMAAKLASPRWDPSPLLRLKAAAMLAQQSADTNPGDVIGRKAASLIHDGDARWATPERADIEALTPEAFRAFWAPQLAAGPLELSVFGDFDRAAAIDSILKSFGALPPRTAVSLAKRGQSVRLAAANKVPVRLTHKGSADQAIALLAWPTGGGLADLRTGRQLDLLAAIFNDRLFEQFREGEGASYSPDVTNIWPDTFLKGGSFSVVAQVRPDNLDTFFSRARAIAADLASTPISPDELQRATGPMLQRLARASTGNAFWMAQLSGASGEPLRITNLLRWKRDIEETTPASLQALAKRYLKPRTGFSIIVVPEAMCAAPNGSVH